MGLLGELQPKLSAVTAASQDAACGVKAKATSVCACMAVIVTHADIPVLPGASRSTHTWHCIL